MSDLIREIPRPLRGFGAVGVAARIGASSWRTSVFPDAERGTYVLPLKRVVRDAEGISEGRTVDVSLDVLDVGQTSSVSAGFRRGHTEFTFVSHFSLTTR